MYVSDHDIFLYNIIDFLRPCSQFAYKIQKNCWLKKLKRINHEKNKHFQVLQSISPTFYGEAAFALKFFCQKITKRTVKNLFLKCQGCIFWPLSPPSRGGKKIGTFGSLGKKIDPSEKKNSIVKKKFEFYKQMFFSITTATLLRNT